MVGEMGIILRQPRSATVEATRLSQVLVVQRPRLESVLREDRDMQAKVYRSILEIISERLINGNVRRHVYQAEKDQYVKAAKEKEQRAEAALELLVKKGGMMRAEAEQHLTAALQDMESIPPGG